MTIIAFLGANGEAKDMSLEGLKRQLGLENLDGLLQLCQAQLQRLFERQTSNIVLKN